MNQLKLEIDRRKSTTARMLEAFKYVGVLTTADLQHHFGTGCSSRLKELRKEGHQIVTSYVKPGFYTYTYKGLKAETELPENWNEIKAQASEGDSSQLAVVD